MKVEVSAISRIRRLRLINFGITQFLIILDITKTESNSCFASASNKPLEIAHRGHTWHDFPWPWESLTPLLYNLQLDDITGIDFDNSLYALGRSYKR